MYMSNTKLTGVCFGCVMIFYPNCQLYHLPGKGGTTILLSRSNSLLSHSKSLYLLRTLESLSLNTGRFVYNMFIIWLAQLVLP